MKRFWIRYYTYFIITITLLSIYRLVVPAFDTHNDMIDAMEYLDEGTAEGGTKPRALIIHEMALLNTKAVKEVCSSLKFLSATYEVRLSHASFEGLVHQPVFHVIIIIGSSSYDKIKEKEQWFLERYCKRLGIGFIVIDWDAGNSDLTFSPSLSKYPITDISSYSIDPDSNLWRVTKDGGDITDGLENSFYNWVAFNIPDISKSRYLPFAYAKHSSGNRKHVVGVLDTGELDGIKKVIFGNTLTFWLHHPIFMDALHMLTDGIISMPMKRIIIIDIDDIFVGVSAKLSKKDVQVRSTCFI